MGCIDGAAMAANDGSRGSPLMQYSDNTPTIHNLAQSIQFYKENDDTFIAAMSDPIGRSVSTTKKVDSEHNRKYNNLTA